MRASERVCSVSESVVKRKQLDEQYSKAYDIPFSTVLKRVMGNGQRDLRGVIWTVVFRSVTCLLSDSTCSKNIFTVL